MQRLNMSICPACQHANVDDARFCASCGGPLVHRCPACGTINARTRMRCHHCAAMLQPEPAMAEVRAALVPTLTDEPPESELTLSLREHMLPKTEPASTPRRAKPVEVPLPPIVADEIEPTASPAPAPRRLQNFAERKAEMRAAVRRARTRNQLNNLADPGEQPEVLLLEPDESTRKRLSEVLAQFGFKARAVGSVREADALVGQVRFAASFIGLGTKDGLAVGLCTRLRALPSAADRPLAVVAMVEKGQHSERVRMELAGADAVLFRPVDRGHVARALEDSGVRLPRDPRAAASRRSRP